MSDELRVDAVVAVGDMEMKSYPNLWIFSDHNGDILKALRHHATELPPNDRIKYVPEPRIRELIAEYDAQGPTGEIEVIQRLERLLADAEPGRGEG